MAAEYSGQSASIATGLDRGRLGQIHTGSGHPILRPTENSLPTLFRAL